ncbi:flavodoxin domain-containing protein [Propionibacteriaceae bacterium Y1923]
MSNVLVGYGTRGGATKDVATSIAAGLEHEGHIVRLANLSSPTPLQGIDAVVVGSGIQAGVFYGEVLGWLDQHSGTLAGLPVAVFNVCLTASDPSKHDAAMAYNQAAVGKLTGVVSQEAFAGRYVPEKVTWWKRLLLRGINKDRAQDHVNAELARAWGVELAAKF